MTTRPKASMHAYGHSVSDTRGMTPKIITVWAPKGGVGKTTLAYELAYMLDGPLIDFEWDSGSASYQWGNLREGLVTDFEGDSCSPSSWWGTKDPEPVEKARLIRAFRTGNAPRP